MRLYIIRHADPDFPNNTITADGHLEAQALAKRLASQGLDRIYVSPLQRALDTVRYTADLLGLEPKIEEWTQELNVRMEDSPWGNTSQWNIPGEAIRSVTPLPTHSTWHDFPYIKTTSTLETFEQLKKSSDEFIKGLGFERVGGKYRILKPGNREKVAVFCHGGFGLTWLAHLLEIPVTLMWTGFWLPPTSVTTILFEERSAEWAVPRCIGLADVYHLHESGLPVKPHGIIGNFE